MTPIPINALKITIYDTTHTQITKVSFPPNRNILKHRKFIVFIFLKLSAFYADLYGINYILYILYFYIFYIFYIFCIFVCFMIR